jgi:hypothetical protein
MRCLRLCLLGVVLIWLLGAAAFSSLLVFASRWLPDSDVAAAADDIVVLAGGRFLAPTP